MLKNGASKWSFVFNIMVCMYSISSFLYKDKVYFNKGNVGNQKNILKCE